MIMEKGLSIGPIQLLEPVCSDCGERGVYHHDYGKTVCERCGQNLRGLEKVWGDGQ